MALITRPIPGLFGGVSQQIPALSHPTHCAVQTNCVATLVDGMGPREGYQHIKSLALTGANGADVSNSTGEVFSHIIDRGSAGRYVLIVKNGNMMVYELATGNAVTVTFPDGKTYLNCADPQNDIRATSVADYTFIVNRTVQTGMTAAYAGGPPINRGLIYIKQIVAASTYNIKVDGYTATYTSDASPTSKEIVDNLITQLNAVLPAGYTVSVVAPTNATEGPVISIIKDSGAATTVGCFDSYGNLAMIAIHDFVPQYTDLPGNLGAMTDYVVKIAPNPSTSKGTFHVKWDPTEQEYAECAAPGSLTTFDPVTLPHKLVLNTDGTMTFSKITSWGLRKAGDDLSNPLPSFVGKKINDVFFARNRLGFLSQDAAVMSRSGKFFEFFAESAQAVLDTDPIDVQSTSDQVVNLEWAVPFNENLLVWSENAQFSLVGGDVMTPKNARLVASTAFDAYMGARPEPLGNKCLFATTAGDFTSIRALRVSQDTVTNEADDLTEHVPRYIPKRPRLIKASTTAKAFVVSSDSFESSLYFFKYEDGEGGTMSQKAWSLFNDAVPTESEGEQIGWILNAHWVDRRLYVLRYTFDIDDSTGRFMLELWDFQSVRTDDDVSFSLRLDRKLKMTTATFDGTHTVMVLPYWDRTTMRVLKCVNGRNPVALPITSTVRNGGGTMTLKVEGDFTASTLWVGKDFHCTYRFMEIFYRDKNGTPQQEAKLSLKKILLRYVNTGYFNVTVTPYLRETYTYEFTANVLGALPLEGAQLGSGNFIIPLHCKPEGTVVEIVTSSFFPATFPYAEWVGNVELKAAR
jgi:hypothetical protein